MVITANVATQAHEGAGVEVGRGRGGGGGLRTGVVGCQLFLTSDASSYEVCCFVASSNSKATN
jgi:hypothetical protein